MLNCGNFRLVYDLQEETLFLGVDEKVTRKTGSIQVGPTEIFGFGSGEFAEGPEATDIMSDVAGRWINYKLGSDSDLLIAESDKRLADHIRSCDIFGKVAWLQREECQKRCQIECQKICQKGCQKICQTECQKIC